ncbi:ABC transporter permease [Tautonia sociabilis]|uniref:ABC transporter permease n=1 Tax=Tautonia sociabilis TaxID=2080755 RepID=A0A432MI08_9BACT|nr:ABC transporter permease subunit [Tautonia sociabilis]RUL86836.1 hypothetical protein TsocGM_15205 [Tautonia sociabilis]
MSRPLASILVGPLVGPECRRASRRGWLFLARSVAALVAAAVVLTVLWWWWISWNEAIDPEFSPFGVLRGALTALVGLETVIALVLGPAVLAGSLSGEQERGSMGLLLTTKVNAFEIVLGRLAGRLSQVLMVLLAIVPPLVLVGALAAIRPGPMLAMLLYGPALAVGAGGLTAGVAVVSRRGREALLGTYAIGLLLTLLGPIASTAGANIPALARLNPFGPLVPLTWADAPGPALGSMLAWLVVGGIGAGVAIGRLRPNSLRWLDGDSGRHRRRAQRRGRVRPLRDRPMLWKEIYIEHKGSLGGLGRWLGYLAVAYLVLASTITVGRYLDALIRLGDVELASLRLIGVQEAVVDPATFFGVFIQWAVGLRAAVAIAGERERGTWDALLTSPLDGSEIVFGKLLGSLHALRWLFLATLLAWSLALGVEAMSPWQYASNLAWTIVIAAFMAAVGVRASLGSATVPTAMAVTIGSWLAAIALLSMLAGILVGVGALLFVLIWVVSSQVGLQVTPTPWFPIGGGTAYLLFQLALFVGVTAAVVAESRARFDRLAGRIVPGDAWPEGGAIAEGAKDFVPAEEANATGDQAEVRG